MLFFSFFFFLAMLFYAQMGQASMSFPTFCLWEEVTPFPGTLPLESHLQQGLRTPACVRSLPSS